MAQYAPKQDLSWSLVVCQTVDYAFEYTTPRFRSPPAALPVLSPRHVVEGWPTTMASVNVEVCYWWGVPYRARLPQQRTCDEARKIDGWMWWISTPVARFCLAGYGPFVGWETSYYLGGGLNSYGCNPVRNRGFLAPYPEHRAEGHYPWHFAALCLSAQPYNEESHFTPCLLPFLEL